MQDFIQLRRSDRQRLFNTIAQRNQLGFLSPHYHPCEKHATGGGYKSTQEVKSSQLVSRELSEQTLLNDFQREEEGKGHQQCCNHNYRGLGGGFSLDREPEEISILEVINAVDPIQRIEVCPLGLEEHASNLCPLHKRLDDAVGLIEEAFAQTKISELLQTPANARLCLFPNLKLQ